jgi:thiosulfate/3-mercaptopyruvate sulfurtransferase
MIDPFIDIDWLEAHRDEVVVADCRWYMDGRSGRDAYEAGHVPGAVFVDLDTALTDHGVDPAEGGRHPLPAPEAFAAAMGGLGIGDGDTVVAYDDAGGVIAGRLVWMLRAIGHESALLDGGLAAWRGELETAPAEREPATFTERPWPTDRLVTVDEAAAIAAASTGPAPGVPPSASPDPTDAPAAASLLIDARQRERYEGEPDGVDPQAGHIPGALSVPCRENLGADGRLLPPEEQRARFPFADDAEVVSYCGSGVTACHNLLAMEQVGLQNGRLFPGSWSQWSRDPARAAETDAATAP